MSTRGRARVLVRRALGCALVLAVALAGAPCGVHAEPGPAAATDVLPLPSRRAVLAFAAGSTAAIALCAANDARWSRALAASGGDGARDAARVAKQFGNHLAVAPALLAVDAGARLAGRPRLAAATERVALSCASAGLVTLALKNAAGRWRPHEDADPRRFEPFSGHDSFPSGHTTMAFSLAGALDAETRSHWVPAIAYPLAAATGWSRVHDHVHWPSDVAAGAAIGTGVAFATDRWAQRALPAGVAAAIWPARGGAVARVRTRF
ncbi:MAG: phosphatase PAP2 family protein [Candidatus Eisenbacteria bacterium]